MHFLKAGTLESFDAAACSNVTDFSDIISDVCSIKSGQFTATCYRGTQQRPADLYIEEHLCAVPTNAPHKAILLCIQLYACHTNPNIIMN